MMSMLWQPRWIVGHLLVLAVVVSFVRLGFWQLDRHRQHVERNERVVARLADPTLGVEELLASAVNVGPAESAEAVKRSLSYRRVDISGRWDTSSELLLRSQSYRGQPGWHVLTPFVLAESEVALIVDRGWVPQGFDRPPVTEAAPPGGAVRLEGVLLPERDPPSGALSGLAARNPTEGPLERTFLIDVERLEPQMPYMLVPAYLVPTEQTPSPTGDLPVPPEPPGSESASHLAYAVQWFVFSLIGVVGYTLLLRQRLREARVERGPGEEPVDERGAGRGAGRGEERGEKRGRMKETPGA